MAIISRPFLTVDEVADLLRVSREWVLRAIHQGTLGHFIIAGKPCITPEQLFDWLRLMEKTPTYGARAERARTRRHLGAYRRRLAMAPKPGDGAA